MAAWSHRCYPSVCFKGRSHSRSMHFDQWPHTHVVSGFIRVYLYSIALHAKRSTLAHFGYKSFSNFESEVTLSTIRVRPATDGHILDEFAYATTGLSVHTRTYHRLLSWTINQRSWVNLPRKYSIVHHHVVIPKRVCSWNSVFYETALCIYFFIYLSSSALYDFLKKKKKNPQFLEKIEVVQEM